MQKAVDMLDGFIHEKTNHSTMKICAAMMEIANTRDIFTSIEAQQDFAQRCSNFQKHSTVIGKRSWGRKEFEAWWNQYDFGMSMVEYSEDARKEREMQHDTLDDGSEFDPPTEFEDLTTAKVYIHTLEQENERLEKEVERLRNTIVRMRAIANDTLNM